MVMERHSIDPALMAWVADIDAMHPYPGNARRHRVDKIMASLTKHGQRTPIVVQQGTGHILKGNGTWTAAGMLGWTHIAAAFVDVDDARARAYLLDDNLTSDLSANDEMALAELLRTTDRTLSIWDDHEVEDALALASAVPGMDELAERYGDADPDEQAFWPKVRLPIPPELLDRWLAAVEPLGKTDAERMRAVVLRLETTNG